VPNMSFNLRTIIKIPFVLKIQYNTHHFMIRRMLHDAVCAKVKNQYNRII